MIKPHSIEEEEKIIRDCVKAASDIQSMTDRAYNYLYLANDFIAHCDKYGFMEFYSEKNSLKNDMLRFQNHNQWANFHPKDDNYDYYMQKKKIYNEICNCLKQGIEYKKAKKNPKEVEFDFGR
jgi:hypothetical protein